MSKELIERLREAAAQRVASTAMIGADDLSAAADALESLDAAYGGAVEAGKALAKQAFKAEQERDGLALRVSELTCQIDRAEEAMVERDALAAELKAVRGDQTPTTDDINLQEWKGMDGACAWHLIDRYAEDWHHTARLMNAWLEANRQDLVAELKALRDQEPVATLRNSSGHIGGLHFDNHAPDILEASMKLYARPVPARELTNEDIQRIWAEHGLDDCDAEGFARAIERYLKGEGK